MIWACRKLGFEDLGWEGVRVRGFGLGGYQGSRIWVERAQRGAACNRTIPNPERQKRRRGNRTYFPKLGVDVQRKDPTKQHLEPKISHMPLASARDLFPPTILRTDHKPPSPVKTVKPKTNDEKQSNANKPQLLSKPQLLNPSFCVKAFPRTRQAPIFTPIKTDVFHTLQKYPRNTMKKQGLSWIPGIPPFIPEKGSPFSKVMCSSAFFWGLNLTKN